MNALEVHSALAAHYTDQGFMAFDHVPDASFAPDDGALVVQPAADWITRDDEDVSFLPGEVIVNLDLLVMVEYRENNEASTCDLALALASIIEHKPDWLALGSMTAPDLLTNGEWSHYGVRIAAKTIATLIK